MTMRTYEEIVEANPNVHKELEAMGLDEARTPKDWLCQEEVDMLLRGVTGEDDEPAQITDGTTGLTPWIEAKKREFLEIMAGEVQKMLREIEYERQLREAVESAEKLATSLVVALKGVQP